jgi:hypothetical protein
VINEVSHCLFNTIQPKLRLLKCEFWSICQNTFRILCEIWQKCYMIDVEVHVLVLHLQTFVFQSPALVHIIFYFSIICASTLYPFVCASALCFCFSNSILLFSLVHHINFGLFSMIRVLLFLCSLCKYCWMVALGRASVFILEKWMPKLL